MKKSEIEGGGGMDGNTVLDWWWVLGILKFERNGTLTVEPISVQNDFSLSFQQYLF